MTQTRAPVPTKHHAGGAITGPGREVHNAVLAAIASTGQSPHRSDSVPLARRNRDDVLVGGLASTLGARRQALPVLAQADGQIRCCPAAGPH